VAGRRLYSTNSLLAYRISKRYYNDKHYVWASPSFGSRSTQEPLIGNPVSSRPASRYKQLREEVRDTDRHGHLIQEQRLGLRTGAQMKHDQGVISKEQRDEIMAVVDAAEIADFKPLLYVFSLDDVKGVVKKVPVNERAHPLSEEYIIEELPGSMFDILDLDLDND